jgi:eukaryotic-like serine/threonine-protein kinase
VKVWDAITSEELLTLRGHNGYVLSVAVSADGKRIVSGSLDQTVKVWDAITGEELLTLRGHNGSVQSVAVRAEGKRIVSGSQDGTIKIWDARPWTRELRAEHLRQVLITNAYDLVVPLFESVGLRDDVLKRIEQDKSLSPELRQYAIEIANCQPESPLALNNLSWQVTARPGAGAADYAMALRQAQGACRLAPVNGNFLNTLGIAEYRAGKYQQAIATLTRSDKLNSTSKQGRQPADVAFLAMAHFKLGGKDKAQSLLAELRQLMKQTQWKDDAEAQRFLREAEALLARK